MDEKLTQDQRLTELVERFKADSGTYKDLETPKDTEGKRRLLRSLMNIRMPKPMASETLRVQDRYLQERAEEKGIVRLEDIPVKEGSVVRVSPEGKRAVRNTGSTPLVMLCIQYNAAPVGSVNPSDGTILPEQVKW